MEKKKPAPVVGYGRKTKTNESFIMLTINEDLKAGSKIALFKNSYKEKESQPDFRGVASKTEAPKAAPKKFVALDKDDSFL